MCLLQETFFTDNTQMYLFLVNEPCTLHYVKTDQYLALNKVVPLLIWCWMHSLDVGLRIAGKQKKMHITHYYNTPSVFTIEEQYHFVELYLTDQISLNTS